MDCREVQREIPSLLYEELDATEEQPLRDHLETCPDCRAEMEYQKKVLALLDQWPGVEAPLDSAGIVRQAHRSPSARRGLSRFAPWFAPPLRRIAVAVAAGLLIVVTLAVIGVEVQRSGSALVVTFGDRGAAAPAREPLPDDLRRLVRNEIESEIWKVFETVAGRLDAVEQEQEQKRFNLVRTVHLQREEDRSYTQELFKRMALETAAESERNRLLLEKIAGLAQAGGLESGSDIDIESMKEIR
jgi:hypothetical protein